MKLTGMLLPLIQSLMPPTRGHDLKLFAGISHCYHFEMPPTRGHDLKLI